MADSDIDEMEEDMGDEHNTQQVMRDLEALGEDAEAFKESKATYRGIFQKAAEMDKNHESINFEQLEKAVKEADAAFKKATPNATISTMDSKVLEKHAGTAAMLGKRARIDANAFEIDQIFGPLRTLLGLDRPEELDVDMDDEGNMPEARANGRLGDWKKVGWMAAKRTRRVMGVEFMHGPLAIEHKKRVIKRRAPQRAAGQVVRPENVVSTAPQKKEHETNSMVLELEQLLVNKTTTAEQTGTKINLFEWFINPDSFGQSVENLFYTSFLLREGKCWVYPSEDGSEPGQFYIMTVEPPDADDDPWPKKQVVSEFTEQVWRDAIEVYQIETSMIPHRSPLQS